MSQKALSHLKDCLVEAQKRGDTLCNCFHSGYKLHSLYYQQFHQNITPKSDDIKLLNNNLNNVCFNLHPRVQQRIYPDPTSLLSLTTEIYNKKWKFIDNVPNNLFSSKLILSNITQFMSNNNSIKDPRLLFKANNDDNDENKLDEQLRSLTHKYCVRMTCCSHYIHPTLDKELKSLHINTIINKYNIDSLYFESFIQSISYYQNNNYLMCLLYTTSFIEKLLGDSLLNNNNDDNNNNNKDIPHNIIDLLMLSTMKQNILNDDIHLLLWCLMGPPFSCNIRNLIWHGFFNNHNHQMIPKHLCSLIIYIVDQLIFIINKNKDDQNINILTKCSRPFQLTLINEFSKWSNIDKIPSLQNITNNNANKSDIVELMDEILKQYSYFIPFQNHKDFMRILKLYLANDNKDYYEIGSVLFCILENSIRRIIVAISNNNDIKEKPISLLPTTRILAEDNILYVSFIYLNHRDLFRMKIPFGLTHQQINKWISNGFMSMLQDLIISNNGPRFRDRLAHFELNTQQIHPILIDILMNLCIYSILRFSWFDLQQNNNDDIKSKKNKHCLNALNDIYEFMDDYKPCYHPLSFCISEWKEFKTLCQDFQIYSAKHFSIDVKTVQCGNKMVNISKVLQITTKLVNKLQSIRKQTDLIETKQNDDDYTNDTPLKYLQFIGDSKRYRLYIKDGKDGDVEQQNDDNDDEFDYDIFENMNQSIIKSMTKMLEIINPSIKMVMNAHKMMDKEINCNDDEDKQIATRKLKQFSKLTHSLSLWSCCLDIIYESIECAFINDIRMPYKLWSKYFQSATKMQNKLRSNQFGEGVLELKQCIDHCQNWINKQKN